MNPIDQIPGQEAYLYTRARDMKCCLHSCSVWDCPEIVCVEDAPQKAGPRGSLAAFRRYQDTLKLYEEYKDINEVAKVLNLDPSTVRRRLKWSSQ